MAYIEPGAPWQNGYAESFHAQARREFLNAEVFVDLTDAHEGGSRYRQFFNDIRPHGALNYKTPAAFAALAIAADGAGDSLKKGL